MGGNGNPRVPVFGGGPPVGGTMPILAQGARLAGPASVDENGAGNPGDG